ncbi:MAG: alpha/beta hydrolase fold domain-containing protein, partial [Bacteroidota bacterium]
MGTEKSLLLVLVGIMLSCTVFGQPDTTLFYGTADRQFLDIYLAPSQCPTPVYFDAHGNGGTTNMPNSITESLKANGISVVAWESLTAINTPGQVQTGWDDAELMFAWVKANAATYNFDTTKFIIGGSSRGSILSWNYGHRVDPNIKGLYMYNALPDGTWADSTWWHPPNEVKATAPPIFFVYRYEPGTTDSHDPLNGMIIMDKYDELGIGDRDTMVHSIEASGNNDRYQFLLEFAQSVLSENQPTNVPTVQADSTFEVITENDIIYAEGLSHDSLNSISATAIPLKLDVYYPNNTSQNRPAFMFIHGGAFEFGSKQQAAIVKMAKFYAARGWVFISIDYRLLGDIGTVPTEWADFAATLPISDEDEASFNAMYPAQRDAKAALRWMVANKEDYNINADFITVGGASAGANTAKGIVISDPDDFTTEISSSQDPTLSTTNLGQTFEVQTIVDFWGGQSVTDAFLAVYGENLFDCKDPVLYKAHGTADFTVPFTSALDLKAIYDSLGITMRLDTLVGIGHGNFNATLEGKRLEELAFDFIVEQQNLIVENGGINNADGSIYCNDDNRFIEVEYFDNSEIDSSMNMVYATVNNQDLELDVYYPDMTIDNLSKRPFIMLIHGGGYVAGNRGLMRNTCFEFAKRGFVAATITHRYGSPPVTSLDPIYQAEQDAHAAMRYMVENAATYRIDTDWIFTGGESSGANIALAMAYTDQTDYDNLNASMSSTHGGLYTSGNDLTNTYSIKGIYNNWGSVIAPSFDSLRNVSIISFHGEQDPIIDIDLNPMTFRGGSRWIYQATTNFGYCNSLNMDSLGGHGVYGYDFRVEKAACFFKSVFCNTCTSISTFDSTPANCSISVLPVEWLSFSGIGQSDKILLKWTVASEYNNLGFEVQKSKDGAYWERLAFLNAQERIDEVFEYQTQDENPYKGNNYYRLVQVDLDGTIEYSKVIVIKFEESKESFQLFPNPASNQIRIGGLSNLHQIEIINSAGKVLYSIYPKDNFQTVDISALPSGLYFVRVRSLNYNSLQVQKV